MPALDFPALPALVRGEVRHQRKTPFAHGLKFKTYEWLVNVDEIPAYIKIETRDHFGSGANSIRAAVESFAKANGEIVNKSDTILMLAAARTNGYVFNPLSVYWCVDENRKLKWVILEIHNTYGDRHAHLVHVDENTKATIAKEFYVSPFFTIAGEYKVTAKIQNDKVVVSVNLHQDNAQVFTASFTGVPLPATLANRIIAKSVTPLATIQTMIRIKFHGIWLWARKLPVIKRTTHPTQEGML